MGKEWCWPWFTPWQFDEFFKLLDDPANLPLAVHCMGGRHRTGTFSALYRLEYDGWPIERVTRGNVLVSIRRKDAVAGI